jgi:type IV pilus assembly protein PilM
MPSLPNLKLSLPTPNLKLNLARRSGAGVVGLDIQPGFVGAVQARVNGAIVAEHIAGLPLASDTVREGEVVDEAALSGVLHELFGSERLGKRVRVGVANQRTVMRTLELPPMTDRKELAAAVSFQAQDQIPMPLGNAVLDFHPLGIVDTPSGPRQRVVLVAAQRDMIEHLLAAVRGAGLQPVGVDLSAFALIRSLYRAEPDSEQVGRVVYLNVDGLTNLAIAEGPVCRFTRVVGGGLEGMAGELAERLSIPLTDARAMLAAVDLTAPATGGQSPPPPPPPEAASQGTASESSAPEGPAPEPPVSEEAPPGEAVSWEPVASPEASISPEHHDALEHAMSYSEMSSMPEGTESEASQEPSAAAGENAEEARGVLENGIREISGEVRNSLDFHRSQDGGGEVSHVVLSGSVLDLPGFTEALESHLGLKVRAETVSAAGEHPGAVSMHRLAVAAGLATAEVPQ